MHVSTDEVYGDVIKGRTNEKYPYNPSSPYSSSKASADHYFKNVENALDDSNSTHMAKYWDEPWKLLVEELNVIKTPEYGSLGYTKVKEINS